MHARRTQVVGFGAAIALVAALAPATMASSHERDAEDYCSKQRGNVVKLTPQLYPDSDNTVELAGSLTVCQFISVENDNPVQLVVDLHTLYSEKPTLAGMAYVSAVPSSNSGVAGSNPAASYCPNDLGGTQTFGTAGKGAWVGELDPGMEAGYSQPLSDTVDLCVFADRSAIDSFGIFYASDDTYRGVELTTVMRWSPNEGTPTVFGTDG